MLQFRNFCRFEFFRDESPFVSIDTSLASPLLMALESHEPAPACLSSLPTLRSYFSRGNHLQTPKHTKLPQTRTFAPPFPLSAISSLLCHVADSYSFFKLRISMIPLEGLEWRPPLLPPPLCPSPSHTGVQRSGYDSVSPTGLRPP